MTTSELIGTIHRIGPQLSPDQRNRIARFAMAVSREETTDARTRQAREVAFEEEQLHGGGLPPASYL